MVVTKAVVVGGTVDVCGVVVTNVVVVGIVDVCGVVVSVIGVVVIAVVSGSAWVQCYKTFSARNLRIFVTS